LVWGEPNLPPRKKLGNFFKKLGEKIYWGFFFGSKKLNRTFEPRKSFNKKYCLIFYLNMSK
jgi:hypothetical protein